ncbi:MAG: hypothetical protein JWP80_434 [Pseudomonas sp.]|nr:hypothetical protein [Pseudomonas sp.]
MIGDFPALAQPGVQQRLPSVDKFGGDLARG